MRAAEKGAFRGGFSHMVRRCEISKNHWYSVLWIVDLSVSGGGDIGHCCTDRSDSYRGRKRRLAVVCIRVPHLITRGPIDPSL